MDRFTLKTLDASIYTSKVITYYINFTFVIYELLAGGLILGAFFMLTDYTTSPITKKGQIIYAILAGVITTVIRLYGGYPEGVSYSILLGNVMTPLIDKYTKTKVFGEVSK